jgi:DME family drug/metabolite transporter
MAAMSAHVRPLLGVLAVVAAAALWGTTGTAQALSGGGLSALWFGALRLAFAALFFAAFAAATGAWSRRAWQGLPAGAAIGAGMAMAAYNLCFFLGVKLTGVGVGTAIALGSGPIWAGVLQGLLQRQPPTWAWWWGTLVAIVGGVLLSAGSGTTQVSLWGVVLCLGSGLSYAVYASLNQHMVARAPASVITMAAFAVATAVALPAAWLQSSAPPLDARAWLAAAYTGVITAGVGYLLFSFALHHLRSATAVTLALTEPVVAFALAVGLLQEASTGAALLGLGLVVSGVLWVVRSELNSATQ